MRVEGCETERERTSARSRETIGRPGTLTFGKPGEPLSVEERRRDASVSKARAVEDKRERSNLLHPRELIQGLDHAPLTAGQPQAADFPVLVGRLDPSFRLASNDSQPIPELRLERLLQLPHARPQAFAILGLEPSSRPSGLAREAEEYEREGDRHEEGQEEEEEDVEREAEAEEWGEDVFSFGLALELRRCGQAGRRLRLLRRKRRRRGRW